MRVFAETIFGTPFEPDAVITEGRLHATEIVPTTDRDDRRARPDEEIPPAASVAAVERERVEPDANEPESWRKHAVRRRSRGHAVQRQISRRTMSGGWRSQVLRRLGDLLDERAS